MAPRVGDEGPARAAGSCRPARSARRDGDADQRAGVVEQIDEEEDEDDRRAAPTSSAPPNRAAGRSARGSAAARRCRRTAMTPIAMPTRRDGEHADEDRAGHALRVERDDDEEAETASSAGRRLAGRPASRRWPGEPATMPAFLQRDDAEEEADAGRDRHAAAIAGCASTIISRSCNRLRIRNSTPEMNTAPSADLPG